MNLIFTYIITLFMLVSDTLGTAYGDDWQGVQGAEQGNLVMQVMTSNNLIFVVLGVSLIIWFVLIAYLFRLEKKLNELEQKNTE